MTEAEKKIADATRFLVLEFGSGDTCEQAYKVKHVTDNEGDARKLVDELALAEAGTHYGVYQKMGTAHAALRVEWKSAPATSPRGGE